MNQDRAEPGNLLPVAATKLNTSSQLESQKSYTWVRKYNITKKCPGKMHARIPHPSALLLRNKDNGEMPRVRFFLAHNSDSECAKADLTGWVNFTIPYSIVTRVPNQMKQNVMLREPHLSGETIGENP